jgi:hypothetical protein
MIKNIIGNVIILRYEINRILFTVKTENPPIVINIKFLIEDMIFEECLDSIIFSFIYNIIF